MSEFTFPTPINVVPVDAIRVRFSVDFGSIPAAGTEISLTATDGFGTTYEVFPEKFTATTKVVQIRTNILASKGEMDLASLSVTVSANGYQPKSLAVVPPES
jgi:hypothetical protein